MKTIITSLFFLLFFYGFSQNTSIPDVNFEKALIELGYDIGNPDGLVPTASIDTITILNIAGKNIADLQGIQNFTLLSQLNCSNNNLTDIKISSNVSLGKLVCINNNLASLNVDENIALVELFCHNNNIVTLNFSENNLLNIVSCSGNQLTSLNIKNGNNTNIFRLDTRNNPNLTCIEVDDSNYSNANWTFIDPQTEFKENCAAMAYVPDDNFEKALIDLGYDMGNLDDYVPIASIDTITDLQITNKSISDLSGIEYFSALEFLNCSENNLTNLNLSKNITLEVLYCDNNSLSDLDVSQNTALTILHCFDNNLTDLNIESNNLNRLYCYNNNLTRLDLRNSTILSMLFCNNNNLNYLNVKNGNNTNIIRFDAQNNANLTCIDVDDKAYSIANWINIDSQSGFSETCNSLSVDDFLKSNIGVYPNPTHTFINIDVNAQIEIETIKIFDVFGRQIQKNKKLNINLSHFSNGTYFIKFETNLGMLVKKIVKK